jgi:hypothetical protein
VTMEEHGVSKIVSVKFHKTDEATTATASLPLVKTGKTGFENSEMMMAT